MSAPADSLALRRLCAEAVFAPLMADAAVLLSSYIEYDAFYRALADAGLLGYAHLWPSVNKTFFTRFSAACAAKGTPYGVSSIIKAVFGEQSLVEWQGPQFNPVRYKGAGWSRAVVTNANVRFSRLLADDDDRRIITDLGNCIVLDVYKGSFDTVMTDFVRRFVPVGHLFFMTRR